MGVSINTEIGDKLFKDEKQFLFDAMEKLSIDFKYYGDDCPYLDAYETTKIFRSGLIPIDTTLYLQLEELTNNKIGLSLIY